MLKITWLVTPLPLENSERLANRSISGRFYWPRTVFALNELSIERGHWKK
jgi:hypothetical protein